MGGTHLSLDWRLMRQSEAWKHVRRSAQTCPCTRKRAKLGAARMAMGADVCLPHAQTQGARRKRVHVHASLWSRDAAHVANTNCEHQLHTLRTPTAVATMPCAALQTSPPSTVGPLPFKKWLFGAKWGAHNLAVVWGWLRCAAGGGGKRRHVVARRSARALQCVAFNKLVLLRGNSASFVVFVIRLRV